MTGHQRGPKQKLQAGYRAHILSMRCSLMLRTLYFSSPSVVLRAFSALCMYLKFGHHPHSLGYHCAKFRFVRGPQCWASHWKKSRTQSLTQLIWCHRNQSFRFGTMCL